MRKTHKQLKCIFAGTLLFLVALKSLFSASWTNYVLTDLLHSAWENVRIFNLALYDFKLKPLNGCIFTGTHTLQILTTPDSMSGSAHDCYDPTGTFDLTPVYGEHTVSLIATINALKYAAQRALLLAQSLLQIQTLNEVLDTARHAASKAWDWCVFAFVSGSSLHEDHTATAAGYYALCGSTTFGAYRYLNENCIIGLASGYQHARTDLYGTGGTLRVDTIPLNIIGMCRQGNFFVNTVLGVGYSVFHNAVNVRGMTMQTVRSHPWAKEAHVSGLLGYDIPCGSWTLTPSVGLLGRKLWISSFTEHGAPALNRRIHRQTADSIQYHTGLAIACNCKIGSTTWRPKVFFRWNRELQNQSRPLEVTHLQTGIRYKTYTPQQDRDSFTLGVSLTSRSQKGTEMSFGYDTTWQKHYSKQKQHEVNTSITISF